MVLFGVLGPVEAVSDAGPLDLGGPQQRALLALLLLRANEVMPRDRLIDELWGDAPPPSARETVKVYVARLRKILDESGDASLLVTRNGGYVFQLEPDQLDLDRFLRLVDDGSRALAIGDAAHAAATLGAALAMWRGSPLVDVADAPFVQSERARLEELRVAALEDRVDAELVLGRSGAVVPELQRIIREYPYRERLRRQLMLALYGSGRQAEALAAYQDARKLFVEELGIEPSNDLRKLERAILAQDPALESQVRTKLPQSRRRLGRALAGVAVVLVAAAAIAAIVLTRRDPQVDVHPNSLAVIDPNSNRLVDDIAVGRAPAFVAAVNDRVWAANTADRTVMEIDPSRRAVRRTIPLDARPVALAGARGSLWVITGAQATGSPLELVRIDPRFAATSGRQALLGRTASHMLRQPLAFATSTIWAPGRFIGTLSRRNATTLATRGIVGLGTDSAVAVAADSVAVWAVTADNRLVRIDPVTEAVVDNVETGGRPLDVTTGGGAVWIASWSDDVVIRYDPIARSSISIAVGDGPAALSFGFGSVWVACGSDGTVWRIDAKTRRVVAHWSLGASPEDVTAGSGAVWVAVYSELPP